MQTTTPLLKRSGIILCAMLLLSSLLVNSQIRLVEVRPTEDKVTIKNFGGSAVDISQYYFCSLFVYPQLQNLTVDSGSLNLAGGASVTLSGFSINDSDGDMGLYLPGSPGNFGNQNFMVDFMQWGDANNGRESVAVAKGIWENDAFMNGTGPFVYNGDGTQNGIEFWAEGTLSTNDEFLT
ncbi:MAG: hypothetical protein HKN90_08645, partial [Flavobacteriaceae bacterium]|nr:hypothetical protein [Flavobacteriaceae bacterium]